MKLLDGSGKELMTVSAIERSGRDLLIRGRIFGTMPLTARLTPAEARRGLRLLRLRDWLFLASFNFR